jgi:SAM-dependent methyltransferase
VGFRARWIDRLWANAESAYRDSILECLRPDPSAFLLDVGCDDGAWTERLRRQLEISPNHVRGLEIAEDRAGLARARGFDVRNGDVEQKWPFEDGSIDVLHANQVIEHVKGLDHFVGESKRVLTPQGVAIVCTENLASWHNVGSLLLGYQPFSLTNVSNRGSIGNPFGRHLGEPPGRESWQHIHVMTLAALRALFAAHGFRIQSVWGAGYHPFTGRLAARLAAFDPRHAHFIGLVARPNA